MGLAPVRRLLYSGSDSLLWLISSPAEAQQHQQPPHADDGTPADAGGSPQRNIPRHSYSELRLVPLIRRYFPSADSLLFQQLLDARGRQHPRYHFHCTQFLPPTAYIDPTVHYFDLERREMRSREVEETEEYDEVPSALTAPFLSREVMYELLIESTERNLFEDEKELDATVWAGVESRCNVTGGAAGDAAAGGGDAWGPRVRPVPCAVMLLRYHGSPVILREHSTVSLGLARAVEEHHALPKGNDTMVVEEDGRSWLLWESKGVSMSASVGGFYGCWTLDELLSSAGYDGAAATTPSAATAAFSSAMCSPIGPFGLNRDSLVVTGCVERDIGEREQPHAWMAACRAFATTIVDSCSPAPPYEQNQQNHGAGGGLPQSLFNPLSLLRRLDIAFVPQISNIPQLQLCRQIHLFMDALDELGSEPPTVGRLQMLQRERNNGPAPGHLRASSAPRGQSYVPTFTTPGVNTLGHMILGAPADVAMMDWNRAMFDGSVLVYGKTPAAMLPPAFVALQERGVCSYFSDGAVVLRFSNSKVIEALQKLWCVPLSDTTESLMMTLTSRVPPQLMYRGELRPPNPNAEWTPKLPGVLRRRQPDLFEGLLLTHEYMQTQDVFAVGREFDGAPFCSLIAPVPHGDERGLFNVRTSALGNPPKGWVSTALLRIPNMSVAFGDLIRCDPAAGCWCVDRTLRAEDVALSWMRRIAGKAREAKDLDSRWLRFQYPGPELTENILDSGRPKMDCKGPIVRFGRFRTWHLQHDGYSYFHSIALRGNTTAAAPVAPVAVGQGSLPADQDADADAYSGTPVLREMGRPTPTPMLSLSPPKSTTEDGAHKSRLSNCNATDDHIGMQAIPPQRNHLSVGCQPPAMPRHPPKLPIFKHMTPRVLAFPASPHGASGGGVGGGVAADMRDEPASVSVLVDAWGAVDMERVPSTYSNSPIISPSMHYTPGAGLIGRSSFWENSFQQQPQHQLQVQQQPPPHPQQYIDPAALGWESPVPTLGRSIRSNGSSTAPALASMQRQSLQWTPNSPHGGFSPSPTMHPLSGALPQSVSPCSRSHGSCTSHTSPSSLAKGPVPFSAAKVPVLNHICTLIDDSHVLISNMESPPNSGASATSTVLERPVTAVTPPPLWKVPYVSKDDESYGKARTARPSDNRDLAVNGSYEEGTISGGSAYQRDEDDDNGAGTLYDEQLKKSPESCLSLSSATQSAIRVYKDDRQQYRWNPYGITRSQPQ